MMTNFMQYSDADLLLELAPSRASSLQRTREDSDPVRSHHRVPGVSFRSRDSLVQPEQLVRAVQFRVITMVGRRFFFYDDHDIVEEGPNISWKAGNDTRH